MTKESNLNFILIKRKAYKTLLGTLLITSLSNAIIPNKNKNPLKISEPTYNSIYEFNKDFPEMKEINLENPLKDTIVDSEVDKIDLSINRENLQLVKKVVFDGLKSDLNDFLYLPNIEEIEIKNYQYLTNEAKNLINNLAHLKRITLIINFKNLQLNSNNIEWIKEDKEITLETKDNSTDLEQVNFYYLYEQLPNAIKARIKVNMFSKDELISLKMILKKIKEIVKSFNFKQETEEQKIIKVAYYVMKKIDYDPEIFSLLNEEKSKKSKDKNAIFNIISNKKVINYNTNILKSILESKDNYGICCNFSGLFKAICLYANIDIEYITGSYNNDSHAWCTFEDNNTTNIIDLTNLDNDLSLIYNITFLEELKSFNENYFEGEKRLEEEILNSLFITPEETIYESYQEKKKINYQRNINYINRRYKDFVKKDYIKYTKNYELFFLVALLNHLALLLKNDKSKKLIKK